jgi:drug/metabolite transporter (DMT)-like permease
MATTAAAVPEQSARQRRGQVYVALAAVAWSSAGVLQRQLSLDVPTQVAGRALSAALALLGAGQIGLGLVLLTIGARLIPAAQVALITLLEVVLGPLWVWLASSEQPDTATLAGGAVVIAAIVIQTRGAPPPEASGMPPPP